MHPWVHEVPFVLSLEKCRRFLPPGVDLLDTDLETIRDALYAVAEIAVEQFVFTGNPAHAVEGDTPMMQDHDPEVRESVSITEVSKVTEVSFKSSSKEEPLDAGKEE